jgi:CRISPR system Cascade subunit CasE
MSTMFLSRARLKSDSSAQALAKVLLPDDPGARAYATHRLAWSLFEGDADDQRDFLYRTDSPDPRRGAQTQLTVLSRREPNKGNPLFDVESKRFEPSLREGDQLGFALRANATRTRKTINGRSLRVDVVMDAIHGAADRTVARSQAIVEAGRAWLEGQGAKSGFRPMDDLSIDGYEQWRFPGRGRSGKVQISTLDFKGILKVTDPHQFLTSLVGGFGRAKSFGCGLMLVRRA